MRLRRPHSRAAAMGMGFFFDDAIAGDQAVLVARRTLIARGRIDLLLALCLALVLVPEVGAGRVVAWAAVVVLAVFSVRRAIVPRHPFPAPRGRAAAKLFLAALSLGVTWGLAGVMLHGAAPGVQLALVLFFATRVGVSAMTSAAMPALFAAEVIPAWGLGLGGTFIDTPALAAALALPVAVHLGVLSHQNRRLHLRLGELVRLRVHNEALVRELQAEQQLARDAWAQVTRQHQELMTAYDRAEELACRDPLTGLYNRRRFFELLDRAVAGEGRLGYCVAVLDIDHFKQVNDGYGHAAGDAALCAVAEVVAGAVRVHDVVARIGGEEIAILFQRVTLPDALRAAERVRAKVEAIRMVATPDLRLSVSVGVAAGGAGEAGHALVARADAAMYAAKHSGRNRVVEAVV